MLKRPWWSFCRTVLTAAALWVLIAVPVAGAVSMISLSALFLFALREMAITAAVLGAIHGLWLFLLCPSPQNSNDSPEKHTNLHRFCSLSGGVLGLMGFLPVYSQTTIFVGYLEIANILAAGVCGGAVAGFVLGQSLSRRGFSPPELRQTLIVGGLLVLSLGAIEYATFWNSVVDRLPLLRISVANLPAGNATGKDWSGCYRFSGIYTDGTGAEGPGILMVKQDGGHLEISPDETWKLQGGIDRDGRFRVGEEISESGLTMRSLWEGKFGSGILFKERDTAFEDGKLVNVYAEKGLGQRIYPCNLNPAP